MVRELELKFRVRDPEAVTLGLKNLGFELSAPVRQLDQAFAPAAWSDGDERTGVAFARLRTVGDQHFFTTKTPVAGVLDCIEHETEVIDRAAMQNAIVAMGYRPTVVIDKTRRSAVRGLLSVCLDAVADVGDFLEVEHLATSDDADPRIVEAVLWEAVPECVDRIADRVLVGYDSLVTLQPDASGTVRG